MAEYCDPASFPVSNVNLTSPGVSGRPSLHLTPRRRVTTWFVPDHLALVASQGMNRSLSGS
jgi:hypothetical protein